MWKLLFNGEGINLCWGGRGDKDLVGGMSKFLAGEGTPPSHSVGKTLLQHKSYILIQFFDLREISEKDPKWVESKLKRT